MRVSVIDATALVGHAMPMNPRHLLDKHFDFKEAP